MCVPVCVRACVRACVCLCVRACVSVSVPVCSSERGKLFAQCLFHTYLTKGASSICRLYVGSVATGMIERLLCCGQPPAPAACNGKRCPHLVCSLTWLGFALLGRVAGRVPPREAAAVVVGTCSQARAHQRVREPTISSGADVDSGLVQPCDRLRRAPRNCLPRGLVAGSLPHHSLAANAQLGEAVSARQRQRPIPG